MSKDRKIYSPSADWTVNAHINSLDKYNEMYNKSIEDPDSFWSDIAKRITWYKPWEKVRDFNFQNGEIKWFENGKLNVSYNCLDRHVESGNGEKTAIIWEGNDPSEDKHFTYNKLLEKVKKFSNVLKDLGIEKGDRVCIYMQMVPELAIAMLACARIGAVHSVVFGAFSADSLRDRINDSQCKLLITQDTGVRGQKNNIPMKLNADKALADTPSINSVVVVKHTGVDINMIDGRDVWWHQQIEKVDAIVIQFTWIQKTLYLFYTHLAVLENRKVFYILLGVILCMHRLPTILSLITRIMMFTGVQLILAGSLGIPTLFMVRFQIRLQLLCSKVCQIIQISDVSGMLLISMK